MTVVWGKSGSLGAQETVGGWGRYNGLVGELGGPDLPGIVFGSGVERILLAANAPEMSPSLDVFVVTLMPEARLPAMRLATALRDEGLVCDLDYAGRSAKGQFRQADRAGARYTVVIGDEELAAGVFSLRDMATGEQRPVPFSDGPRELLRALAS